MGERSGPLISRADFNRVIRIFYRVVKEIVISSSLNIQLSQQLRKMDIGEVMEVTQGPALDSSVNVYRICGKALKDGLSGWVTVAGNQGVTFLSPGGGLFKVAKSTNLSKELKDEKENDVRQLKEGEVVEVLDWGRTSRSAFGVTRLKVRVQNDGAFADPSSRSAVGWVTMLNNEGHIFLEV